MRKFYFLLVLIMVASLALAKTPLNNKAPIQNLPLITGMENVAAPVAYPPYNIPYGYGTDEIGDTIKVGTTWYGNQHNGTIGRMLEKDADGWIHVAWMNGVTIQATSRHIYYNLLDPNDVQNWPGVGIQVDGAQRGGFTTMDADFDGLAIVAFHQSFDGTIHFSALANDILPHTGAFQTWQVPDQPPPGMTNNVIWPRMQIDHQQRIHVVSTETSPNAGDPQRIMYSYGTYDAGSFTINYPAPPNTWQLVDTTMTIAADIATSDVSNKVAIAWTHSRYYDGPPDTAGPNQYNNDIFYVVSNNGVNFNFANPTNLTNFLWPEASYLPDTLLADMDTLRAYTDIGTFYDMNDYLHIAFTTPAYYEFEGLISVTNSLVWHWSEAYPDEFHLVANGWVDSYWLPGAWSRNVQRPSMGQDPLTGNLYCMYQQYMQDSLQGSHAEWPSGDVFISVSTDGGLSWSVGTNITDTPTPDSAAAGACLSELTPTMGKVVDNYCHVFYVMDRDAGNVLQTEGDWTLNTVYYHRVPKTEINLTPMIADTIPFHVTQQGVKPQGGTVQTVKVFDLKQNYPNPFNPTTAITFSLDRMGEVALNVYNLKGEIVATVASGNYTAGAHTVTFDGSNLASGIYLYRLKTGDRTLENKMLLLK